MTAANNTVKLAFVSEDGETISAHFGQAPKVVVITLENGQVVQREIRDKSIGGHGNHAHDHDHDHDHEHSHVAFYDGDGDDISRTHQQEHPHRHNHERMLESMRDCNVLVARGMGVPAMTKSENMGLRVLLVKEKSIDEALRAYIAGTLEHDPRRLHSH